MQGKTVIRRRVVALAVSGFLALGIYIGIVPPIVLAQEASPSPLFEDHFDDSKLPGWDITGNVQQADLNGVNSLKLAYFPDFDDVGGSIARAELQDLNWGTQPFRLVARFWGSDSEFTFNILRQETSYRVDRYLVNIRISQGVLTTSLFRQTGKSIIRIDEQTGRFDGRAWHTLNLSFSRGEIITQIYRQQEQDNPVIRMSYQDPDPLSPGSFEVELQSGTVYLDSVAFFAQEYSFTGAVIQEIPGKNSQPLPNVVVEVYGSNSRWPDGATWLNSTHTNSDGLFILTAPVGFEYYSIHEVNPEGYLSTKADSNLGQVLNFDWVEFAVHSQILRDYVALPRQSIIFYDFLAPTITPSPTFTPSNTPSQTPTATKTATATQTATQTLTPTSSLTPTSTYSPTPTATDTPTPTSTPPPPTLIPPWQNAQCPPAESLLIDHLPPSQAAGWSANGDVDFQNYPLIMKGPASLVYDVPDFHPNDWQNYRVRLVASFKHMQSSLRNSTDGRYLIEFDPARVAIYRESDGKPQLKAEGVYRLGTRAGHYVETGVQAGRIWAAVDGIPIVEWTDPDPLPAGLTGLYVPGQGMPRQGMPGQNQAALAAFWVCSKPIRDTPPTALLLIGFALGGLAAGGFLLIGRLGGPPDPSRPPKLLPPALGIPPIRLANAWLTNGGRGKGKPLRPNQTLVKSAVYSLHIQIQMRQKQTRQDTRRANRAGKPIPLDIVVFSAEGDFTRRKSSRAHLELAPAGPSQEIYLPLQPLRSGTHRVRIGVYHNNVLLQSIYVDMEVTKKRHHQKDAIMRGVDYVASARFDNLESLGSPLLSVFTNQAADGQHWLGLFSAAPDSPNWLQQGFVCTFPAGKLEVLAGQMRSALSKAAGEKMYRMDYDPPPQSTMLELRAKDLLDLADTGYRVFDELFLALQDTRKPGYLKGMRALISNSGTVSIAHCREEGVSFPWAALYDYPLNIDRPESLQVCDIFEHWVKHNAWLDRTHPGTIDNLLDDPQTCRARPNCPLHGPGAEHTVCPFGFWGIRQQVEEPLQLVQPQSLDTVPNEITDPAFDATARIQVYPGEKIQMGMAMYNGFPEADQHLAHFKQRNGSSPHLAPLDLFATFEPEQALQMLRSGGRHLLYFYCHGEEKDSVFRLRVGSPQRSGLISSAALNPLNITWPDQPQPLVFLNGCESGAFTTKLIHGFFSKLRNLGASGIIGVEIKNWSTFASQFGEILVEAVLDGQSTGEAFLQARRLFLRQGNPLGLVYSLHGPARLHLHREGNCLVCNPVPQSAIDRSKSAERSV